MKTYIEKKPLADNPKFSRKREDALNGLDFNAIDAPIVDLIRGMAKLPYCYTLQCCFGHFVYDKQRDIYNLEPLKQIDGPLDVEYRIAYIALCVDNNKDGIELLADLEDVVNIDKDYIQFGCAGWFWKRPVNSYVLQVQPERLKSKDKMIVDIQEAYHIEKVKTRFFGRLRKIVFGLIQ